MAARTPNHFVSGVKTYGQLTGITRRSAGADAFKAFRASYQHLVKGGRLGALLFQFPPGSWTRQHSGPTYERWPTRWPLTGVRPGFSTTPGLLPPGVPMPLDILLDLGLGYVVVDAPQVPAGPFH